MSVIWTVLKQFISEAPWSPTVIPGGGGSGQPRASLGVTRDDGGITMKTVGGMTKLHQAKAKKDWPHAFRFLPFEPRLGNFVDVYGKLGFISNDKDEWLWDDDMDAWQLA